MAGIAASLIFGVNAITRAVIGYVDGYLAEKIIDFFSNRSMTDFILSRSMNIFFNTENDTDLIKVFNSFCLPDFQNRRVNEYFETIMREVSDAICITNELPFVSLHFNEDHLLYSVMNS